VPKSNWGNLCYEKEKEKLSKIKDGAAKALLPSVMLTQINDVYEIIE